MTGTSQDEMADLIITALIEKLGGEVFLTDEDVQTAKQKTTLIFRNESGEMRLETGYN